MLLSPKIFPTDAILNLSIKADAEAHRALVNLCSRVEQIQTPRSKPPQECCALKLVYVDGCLKALQFPSWACDSFFF